MVSGQCQYQVMASGHCQPHVIFVKFGIMCQAYTLMLIWFINVSINEKKVESPLLEC